MGQEQSTAAGDGTGAVEGGSEVQHDASLQTADQVQHDTASAAPAGEPQTAAGAGGAEAAVKDAEEEAQKAVPQVADTVQAAELPAPVAESAAPANELLQASPAAWVAAGPDAADAPPAAVPDMGAMPKETEVLTRLLLSLGQCPGNTMAVAQIQEKLPPTLRRMAEDTESICRWLRKFPGLLEVRGPAGQEQVVLTVGVLPQAGAAPAAVAAPAPEELEIRGHRWEFREQERLAAPTSVALVASQQPAEQVGLPPGPVPASRQSGNVGALAEDHRETHEDNPSTLQLRGLPFRATIVDIKTFLGEHCAGLAPTEPAIRLLLNRDGRPSGFARVHFASPQGAQACREALHRKQMGDRYVEVLACADRAGKMRQRKSAEIDSMAGTASGGGVGDGAADYAERERVLQECRDHMRMPGRNQLLLSMLGIALSQPARAFLRRANLGLKHFLARSPHEFRVEGPKGCERVIWCGAGSEVSAGYVGSTVAAVAMAPWMTGIPTAVGLVGEPGSPKPSPATMGSSGGHSGRCVVTPSDWGTPGPCLPQQDAAAVQASDGSTEEMEYAAAAAAASAWGGWPPWDGGQWMPWGDPNGALTASAKSDTKKRNNRSETAPTRSHAHLHPQSHPFANKATTATESTTTPSSEQGEAKNHVAALRLRGLPFSMNVQDVLAFFAQHDVADRIADEPQAAKILPKGNGRPSGQAVVQMRSRQDADFACTRLSQQWIGGRYIEVFVYGGDEAEGVQGFLEGATAEAAGLGCHGYGGAPDHAGWMPPVAPPWGAMPPWAGYVPPPPNPGVPGAIGGMEGDQRAAEDHMAELFGFLWQNPAAGAQVPGQGVMGPGGAGAVGAHVQAAAPATEAPAARTTLTLL